MGNQGKPLTPEEKKSIIALKKYFDRTKDDLLEQATPSVQRVVNTTGFGIATVKRIMAEHNRGIKFMAQLGNAFLSVTAKTCSGLIKKVRQNEDRFWTEDALLDQKVDG